MDSLQPGAGILGSGYRAQAPAMCSPTSGKADLTLLMQVESAAAQKIRIKELVPAENKLCGATPHCVRHRDGPARALAGPRPELCLLPSTGQHGARALRKGAPLDR